LELLSISKANVMPGEVSYENKIINRFQEVGLTQEGTEKSR
jgi:hypothetical protein